MKAKILLTASAVALLATGCNFKTESAWSADKGGEHRSCEVLDSKLSTDDKGHTTIVGKCKLYYNGQVVDYVQKPAFKTQAPFAVGTSILYQVAK